MLASFSADRATLKVKPMFQRSGLESDLAG
jgi:hypothetical protein